MFFRLSSSILESCCSSHMSSSSWMEVLLLPCFRRYCFSAMHILFCLAFVNVMARGIPKALPRQQSIARGTRFHLMQLASFIMAALHSGNATWQLFLGFHHAHWSICTTVFSVARSFAWTASCFILSCEAKHALPVHLTVLRAWWIGSFVTSLFSILRYLDIWFTNRSEFHLDPNLLVTASTFPVALAFFVAAYSGKTGISCSAAEDNSSNLTKPLIEDSDPSPKNVSLYENAGLVSRLLFLWVGPLLKRGSQETLQVDDIPALMTNARAETLYDSFERNYQRTEGVARALIDSHLPQIVHTGCLYLLKLSVMYVGPLMIQQFISFASKPDKHWTEGVRLVLILLLAKVVEEMTERQRSFLVWKLCLAVKSSLVTGVFRKSLRLSTFARQSHGTGQIVNYMSVDVEDISNLMFNIHNLWVMPMQIIVALLILFRTMGVSTLSGFGTMLGLLGICLVVSSRQRKFWKQIMTCKDNRLKATNEAISNIKILKMQAWQDWFMNKVEQAREEERLWSVKLMYVTATSIFFLWLSPLAVSVATFGTCVLLGQELTAGRVFTATATIRILQEPLRSFPSVIMAGSQALTSLARLKRYLESDEIDCNAVDRVPHGETFAVTVENASFKWDHEAETPILHNIDLQVKAGTLVTVVGTVGSGKSSLLACMLGEMEKLSGKIKLSGQLAYVAQSPWIQNGTIEDNILFGNSMNLERYTETLRVCSLDCDLGQFMHGDKTVIGERGFNLSGGQKQRIQLARAVYQDADVYLLDDIFSAVDAHTGTSLFMECIKGVLAKKTVILVTHQIEFLHGADTILVMKEGRIVQAGNFESLLENGVHFSDLVDAHNQALQTITIDQGDVTQPSEASQVKEKRGKAVLRQEATSPDPSTNLGEEEERAQGRVDKSVYWAYIMQAFNGFHVLILLLIQSTWQAFQIGSDFWLAYSTSDKVRQFFQPGKFILVYSALALGSSLFVLMRTVLISFCGLMTAQRLYTSMLRSVFRAPMSFFDATPTGRILTRSSTDQVLVDFTIPFLYGSSLANGFQLIGVLIVTSKITWQLVLVIVPLLWIYLSYQKYFISTSRELTRLKSVTDAPVIHHFKETISGFMTIRAFGHSQRFAEVNAQRVDTNISISLHNGGANDWLSIRIETIGIVILCSSALFLVLLPKGFVNPENVGLSLSYGLSLSGCLNNMIYYLCQIEQNMVAVERILQYSSIKREQPEATKDKHPSDSWPEHGNVAVQGLQIRYRPGLPLVLKDVSFAVQAGDKLGVVGRTGSGKSSFIQALFRLVEPVEGTILIDGLDIRGICLNHLRSKLSIIPQEPTLFEGTVRINIDPLGIYEDHEIWQALEKCQLAGTVRQKEKQLDAEVSESGENWSMGQRQLFCLGRVLLKHSRILVLDEATASIDTQTDWLLQDIIKQEFVNCTVISIAHRIPSVMDSDKVLVLDNGEMKEFGAPSVLLERRSSLFAGLVHEYWSRSRSAQNLSEMN